MTGSPRALIPLTCKRRRHYWTRWHNATSVDTPYAPQQCEVRVHNPLSVKHFHEGSAGNARERSLKSRIGEVRRKRCRQDPWPEDPEMRPEGLRSSTGDRKGAVAAEYCDRMAE